MRHIGLNPIDQSTLRTIAPSVYADHAYSGVSQSYSFLPTSHVVNALEAQGLRVYAAKQSRTRLDDKRGFTKHTLRFRIPSASPMALGEVHPEVIVTNAHDTGSSYIVEMGCFRLVCTNGLVVSSALFGSYRVRHVGVSLDNVIEATYKVIDQFPLLAETVNKWRSITLAPERALALAESALALRWEKAEARPLTADRLLSARRYADNGSDLWSVFNVIQENLLRGGQRGYNPATHRYMPRTRAINSVDADLTLNRGLWQLAEEYANA